jgi:hypothetical protein
LLARIDLPLDIRQLIAVEVSKSLSSFVTQCGWLTEERTKRAAREACEKTIVALTIEAQMDEVQKLITCLRNNEQLTPALILRALLSRRSEFVEAAFADLSGMPLSRVCGLLHDKRGNSFAALYKKAGLPLHLKPAFEAALAAMHEMGRPAHSVAEVHLSRRMIERVLTACQNLPQDEISKVTALLRRYDMEAARDEARTMAEAMADDAALALVLEHNPAALIEHHTDDELLSHAA